MYIKLSDTLFDTENSQFSVFGLNRPITLLHKIEVCVFFFKVKLSLNDTSVSIEVDVLKVLLEDLEV